MSPLEIWCNESQRERYVLAVSTEKLPHFTAICEREQEPFCCHW